MAILKSHPDWRERALEDTRILLAGDVLNLERAEVNRKLIQWVEPIVWEADVLVVKHLTPTEARNTVRSLALSSTDFRKMSMVVSVCSEEVYHAKLVTVAAAFRTADGEVVDLVEVDRVSMVDRYGPSDSFKEHWHPMIDRVSNAIRSEYERYKKSLVADVAAAIIEVEKNKNEILMKWANNGEPFEFEDEEIEEGD